MKKVAYIASECVPFIKTGGLADVVGTLPRIFDKKEYDVRVIIPNYMCLPAKFKEKMRYLTPTPTRIVTIPITRLLIPIALIL